MMDWSDGRPFPKKTAEEEAAFWNQTAHWSISKPLGSINCKEFKKMAQAFHDAAAKVYGMPATIEITVSDNIPFYPSGLIHELDFEREWRIRDQEKHILLKTGDLNALDKIWADAYSVKVVVNPAIKSGELSSAFGMISYDFDRSGASCYMQANKRDVRSARQAVVAAKPRWSRARQG